MMSSFSDRAAYADGMAHTALAQDTVGPAGVGVGVAGAELLNWCQKGVTGGLGVNKLRLNPDKVAALSTRTGPQRGAGRTAGLPSPEDSGRYL